ncbi:putative inorganic phosphate transporter 1-5 [Morella rubra]|uniref:Putative inorganic phosphate transporter 1-5 n=1 Tax=Morella rubra TaxID=262757 RepID=A0A6A1W2V8_9ROSI|nr:putative inorganic phosphate transporter 1-5 [Morella rubra]
MIGAFGFLYLAESTHIKQTDRGYSRGIGVKNTLLILAGINAFGVLFTFLVPEAKGKSLEEWEGEDEATVETIETIKE